MLALALYLALVTAGIVSLVAVADGSGTQTENEVFGYLFAAVVLASFAVVIHLLGRGVGKLVTGADNRISTSKIQVVLWTFLIAATILALIAQDWVGLNDGWEAISSLNIDEFGPYLVLLGGPFAAAIAAKSLVRSQVEDGNAAKPPGEPQVSQAFTNDAGSADLIDSQYLLFNLIAVIYFVGAFIGSPDDGLPTIPTFLYILTGASALGYVSNKAIPSGPPKIESVSPATAKLGKEVTVFGEGLLFPLDPTATAPATTQAQYHDVQVMIGGRETEIVPGSLSCSTTGGDRLKVTVPVGLKPGEEYDVVALNFRGTATEPVKLKVEAS
ncbi:MAG TPA: IPT/TIG domain-containing protein, partial [Solirubrobacterales bacterium]|nr:IPT/TIG domain-containing protein [Solirubrobacterales bacterium]